MSEPKSRSDGFLWPPGPPDAKTPRDSTDSARPVSPTIDPRPVKKTLGTWRVIENAWLGPRATSFAHRSREAGWVPDTPEAYCPRCAASVGPFEADAKGCAECREKRLPWSLALRLGEYDSVLRSAIQDLKFSAWRRVGRELGQRLGEAIHQRMSESAFVDARLVFIPIPTSYRRRITRGIDHSLVLATAAGRMTGAPVKRVLRREHRPEQWAVAPSERARNVSGAFAVRRMTPAEGCVFVLIDDIRTSGATMRSAARALLAGYRGAGQTPPLALVSAVVAVSSGRRRRSADGSPDWGARAAAVGPVESRKMERTL